MSELAFDLLVPFYKADSMSTLVMGKAMRQIMHLATYLAFRTLLARHIQIGRAHV